MKFLTLALLATTLLAANANAGIPLSTKNAAVKVGNALTPVLGTTASPTIFALMLHTCLTDPSGETKALACPMATITAPVSSTVLAVLLKEDIQQVEADAYNVLAGEEISLALEEQINKMRETFPTLAEESDEFIIATMLELQTLL